MSTIANLYNNLKALCNQWFYTKTEVNNLVQVKEVSINMGSIASGQTATKTATVPSCPSGYSTMIALKTTSWCICSGASVNGTTLSLTGMNTSTGSHTCWITVYVIHYPNTWTK